MQSGFACLHHFRLLVVSGQLALHWAKTRVCPVQRSLWNDRLSERGYIFFPYVEPKKDAELGRGKYCV